MSVSVSMVSDKRKCKHEARALRLIDVEFPFMSLCLSDLLYKPVYSAIEILTSSVLVLYDSAWILNPALLSASVLKLLNFTVYRISANSYLP